MSRECPMKCFLNLCHRNYWQLNALEIHNGDIPMQPVNLVFIGRCLMGFCVQHCELWNNQVQFHLQSPICSYFILRISICSPFGLSNGMPSPPYDFPRCWIHGIFMTLKNNKKVGPISYLCKLIPLYNRVSWAVFSIMSIKSNYRNAWRQFIDHLQVDFIDYN